MTPMRVVAVDDDWTITKLIRRNLESENIHVVEASTGLDCIRVINEGGVDLILLDLVLPDFNGWGILSLLKLTDSLRDIPVIVISVDPPDAGLLRLFKPEDYIQKPFDIRDLMGRVKRLLEKKYVR